MVISGGPGAAPDAAMRACRSGSAKNFSKCPAVSHSSTTTTKPSPTAKRWCPAARRPGVLGHLREVTAVISESLTEPGDVTLELRNDKHAHDLDPSLEFHARTAAQPPVQVRRRRQRRITRLVSP